MNFLLVATGFLNCLKSDSAKHFNIQFTIIDVTALHHIDLLALVWNLLTAIEMKGIYRTAPLPSHSTWIKTKKMIRRLELKGQYHEDIAVLGQFWAKIIT